MSEPDESGGGLAVMAAISASLGRVADNMDRQMSRRARLVDQLHQVPIGPQQITLTAGAGAMQQAEGFGPKAGYMWSVRRLIMSGFTAGTVVTYKSALAVGGVIVGTPEPVAPFATAGVLTFGRGELLLDQNDNLVFTAAGITGYVQINGAADNFERWLLPDYLGIG